MRIRSLRSRLALTYAGIALLTAAVLGGILLSVLGGYYGRAEDAYLRASADRIVRDIPPTSDAAALTRWAQFAALATQTRVRLYTASGALLADSGSPRDLNPASLVGPGDMMGPRHFGRVRLPRPLGEGIFGGGEPNAPRSSRTLQVSIASGTGADAGGFVALSEAPASGRDVLVGVAEAWLLAAGLAVALAALAGYLLSSRISRPLVVLTETSDRMAEGDLTARAPVDREDELGRLAESFNAMADRIESTVTALRRFVADAAHEIGTPLTALQADLELADAEATTADERRLVGRALGQARRLEALSQNLLRLSRIEAGDPSGVLEPVDVTALANEELDAIASRAEQAGLELESSISAGLTVMAQQGKLQVVLDSLLDNALKFTPSGGTISLDAHAEGLDVVVGVSDTGIGIPEAEHHNVFERFHRARNVASHPGSGLGLAIVRATVESYGGSVAFESTPSGTRFEVRLPAA